MNDSLPIVPWKPALKQGARVAVTGASGGVGGHVVRLLAAAGLSIIAIDRIPLVETPLWEDLAADGTRGRVEWHQINLAYLQDHSGLLQGCSALVHCAALVSLTEGIADFEAHNVEVSRRLFEAAREVGVEHVVLMSCAALYKPASGMLDEASEVILENAYERSKRAAEELLEEGSFGQGWTILRPGHVYGPYCKTMGANFATLPPILRQVVSYLPGLSGGPRSTWCHAEDVARAVLFVLGREQTRGQIYNVGDATPLGFGEVITTITEAIGLEIGPMLPFPVTITRGVLAPLINNAPFFDTLRRVLRQRWKKVQVGHHIRSPLRPRVDRNALLYTRGDMILDTSALRALGWEPRWENLRVGIVEAVRWYQQAGWLPSYDTQTMAELELSEYAAGVGFGEELEGNLHLASGGIRKAALELDVSFSSLRAMTLKHRGHLDGSIAIEGLVRAGTILGTIEVDLFSSKVTYEFGFRADDGMAHRFAGEKHLGGRHPVKALEHLDGELYDAHGELVGELMLSYDLGARLLPLLASLRFLLREDASV